MTTELGILGLYGLVVIITILVQATAANGQVGMWTLVKPRDDMPKLTGVAGRLDRAQLNSIVAMALFAPAILILNAKGLFTPTTLLISQAFLVARIIYVIVYAAGLPWIRTIAWMVGFLGTAWLYIAGLGAAAVVQ